MCSTIAMLAGCASDDVGDTNTGGGASDVSTSMAAMNDGSTSVSSGEGTSVGSAATSGGPSTGDSADEATSDPMPEMPTSGGEEPAGRVPEFALLDVNPSSATYDGTVSPRDYLDKASGWYFTHAT